MQYKYKVECLETGPGSNHLGIFGVLEIIYIAHVLRICGWDLVQEVHQAYCTQSDTAGVL